MDLQKSNTKTSIQTKVSSPEPKENVPAPVQQQDLQHQQQEQHQEQDSLQPFSRQNNIDTKTRSAAAQETQGPSFLKQPSSQQTILKAYRSYRDAMGSKDKIKEPIFYCGECEYPFKLQGDLNVHIKRHNEFHCTKCNKDFQSKSDLKFHISYESNCERQWNCKECAYQGNSQMLL